MANLSQQIQGFAFYNSQVFFAAFNLPKYANLKKGIWKLYRLQAIRSIRLSLLSITKKRLIQYTIILNHLASFLYYAL